MVDEVTGIIRKHPEESAAQRHDRHDLRVSQQGVLCAQIGLLQVDRSLNRGCVGAQGPDAPYELRADLRGEGAAREELGPDAGTPTDVGKLCESVAEPRPTTAGTEHPPLRCRR